MRPGTYDARNVYGWTAGKLGSVDEDAKIWLNGALIANHPMEGDEGWKTPFTIDITDHVRFNETNFLAVQVRDSASQGGIYKRVWIMEE